MSGAINLAKSLVGAKSPSTVFYGIGQNITQGLANGIAAGTAPVVGATTALIAAATAAVGAALAASDPQLVGSVADLLDQVTNAVANGQPEIIAGIQAVAHGMTTAWTIAVSTAGPSFDQSIADLLDQVKNAVANGQPGIVAAITAAANGITAAATTAAPYNPNTSGQLEIIGNGFASGTGMGTFQGMTMVGEKGPELANFGSPVQIIPNNALNTSAGGGGNVVYLTSSPTFTLYGTPESMLRQMQDLIDQGNQKLDHLIKARGR